jgi:hypothetical protein
MLPATGNAQQPIVADIASVWTHEQTGPASFNSTPHNAT